MTEPAGVEGRLLAIARGEQPVEDLDSMGLSLSGDTGHRLLQSSGGMTVVPVSWQDLAVGFLHHSGQSTLEEWASFVLMANYDFPEERGDDTERFLTALHDVANGWPTSPDLYELAERLSVAETRSAH